MVDTQEVDLRQDLRGWQILLIVISVIIGEGIFFGNGSALATSGPGGTLLALFIVGIVVICVMECVSELVQLFGCPNALVAYIEIFVDKHLAVVCGVAYWYTWASIFAALNLTAGNYSLYWNLRDIWVIIVFYVFAPIIFLFINLCGVFIFGWIEAIGGALKVALVFTTGVIMYVFAGQFSDSSDPRPLFVGFQVDRNVAANRVAAVCWNLPVIAYGFLGPESVALTAFEARSSRSLKFPSRYVAYFILLLYLFTTIGELYMVSWTDHQLPSNTIRNTSTPISGTDNRGASAAPRILPVIAANIVRQPRIAWFLNACAIFSVFSAANSALYVSSRTLYGLTRDLDEGHFVTRQLKKLSKVDKRTKVPSRALMVSMLSFFWLPFLQLARSYPLLSLLTILQTTASVSCLIVWSALCLAYIRYHLWLKECKQYLRQPEYSHLSRDSEKYKAWTVMFSYQPVPAYIGLIGSLLIVFVFTSATWWHNQEELAYRIGVAYAAPILFIGLWLVLKLFVYVFKRHEFSWFVTIDDDFTRLYRGLETLMWLKNADRVEGSSRSQAERSVRGSLELSVRVAASERIAVPETGGISRRSEISEPPSSVQPLADQQNR